ncbi:hypothetical protein T07_1171 [Trichinella nelsoni]|uniref:Uncharacterized protein n=1 Tax=Trichinella nelsoni TaxID=6336 RepID=A0A0V0SL45_9BILA|nr:hypothetical protein T07_1171 [Trichinella nelsoni]
MGQTKKSMANQSISWLASQTDRQTDRQPRPWLKRKVIASSSSTSNREAEKTQSCHRRQLQTLIMRVVLLLHKRSRGKKGSLPCRRQTLIGQRNSRHSSSKNNDDCLWANFLVQELYFCRPTDRPTVSTVVVVVVCCARQPKTNEPQPQEREKKNI